MTTQATPQAKPAKVDLRDAKKDKSMALQKAMIDGNYERLANARANNDKVAYTFVPGNLNELLMCFDLVGNYPEINAIQNGMRKQSGRFIMEAEKNGHSEDVCTYVKTDVGMVLNGNIGPNGKPLPLPDVLLLSYTGCFTFMKWFELLRQHYKCETLMLHVPYEGRNGPTKNSRAYVVKQLKETIIPALERISGKKFDIDKLREHLKESARAEENWVWVLESAKHKPSPIDSYFGSVYYVGPMFTAFRGTPQAVEYYDTLRGEIQDRIDRKLGPVTPEGEMGQEKYRLIVEGPPNYTSFREFWKMFYDEGAVVVASTYTKVGGTFDFGFRHNPDEPLETLADYCLGCYTNITLPGRVKMITDYINDYQADGLLVNSVKSCNAFAAGELLMMNEVQRRTGKPGAFIETDLVDPRYFTPSNVKNRLESYFQMIEQKRRAA